MMDNFQNYKGQWVSRNPIKSSDGQVTHKFLNVIKYEDGYIRAVGENILLEEFQKKYCRPNEIADPEHDPFKSKDVMKGISTEDVHVSKPEPKKVEQLKNDEYISEKLGIDGYEKLTKAIIEPHPSKTADLTKFSETEKFLIKAIDLSSASSLDNHIEIRGMDIDIPLSFNIHKIIQIADTMGIEGDSLQRVLKLEFSKSETIEPIVNMLMESIIELSKKSA